VHNNKNQPLLDQASKSYTDIPTQTNLTDTIEILLKAALNFEVTENKLFVH
jgi:hypothetical protein